MSEYLQLTRTGEFKLFKFDTDLNQKYRSKKIDGKFVVVDKATKEVIEFPDEKSRSDFFHKESEIQSILIHLRNMIHLEDGVTLGNLEDAISKHQDLASFMGIICPLYPQMNAAADDEAEANEMIVCTKLLIEKGTIDVERNLGFTNSRNWGRNTLLSFDPVCPIDDDEDLKLNPIQTIYSLVDVLLAIWSNWTPMPVALMKDGVYDESGIKVEEPCEVLNRPCALAEDVTLGDIFDFMDKHEMLKMFIGFYSWCHSMDEFHAAAKEEPSPDRDDAEKLWFLEIYRSQSIYSKRRRNISYLEQMAEMHAIGELSESEKEYYKNNPDAEQRDCTHYGIGMMSTADLKHLPFKLKDLDFIVHGDKYEIKFRKEYKTHYTLWDILDAIYWEISFYGGPEESEELKEELDRRLADVDNGTAGLRPWSELRDEVEAKLNENEGK